MVGNLFAKKERMRAIRSEDSVRLIAFARTSKEAMTRSVTRVGMSP